MIRVSFDEDETKMSRFYIRRKKLCDYRLLISGLRLSLKTADLLRVVQFGVPVE